MTSPKPKPDASTAAWRFVVLMGGVSLLADLTYEGARGLLGPWLGVLGASAAAVGVVAGAGELLGSTLRFATGRLADRTRRYWGLTLAGYAINLLAVPAMALAGSWEAVAVLVALERSGKALRAPARDALLARAAERVGMGRAFGVHEALDQVGAVTGPLVLSAMLAAGAGYRHALATLLVPALGALALLLVARSLYPRPGESAGRAGDGGGARDTGEGDGGAPRGDGEARRRRRLLLGAALLAFGFVDFPLVAFHAQRTGAVGAAWVPALYALAMGVDAVAALVLGRAFDRRPARVLGGALGVAALSAPLAFLGGAAGLGAGMFAWGIGMGASESIVRAAVARLAAPRRRASAFGSFHAVHGMAWFAGSTVAGVLYAHAPVALVGVSAASMGAGAIVMARAVRVSPTRRGG